MIFFRSSLECFPTFPCSLVSLLCQSSWLFTTSPGCLGNYSLTTNPKEYSPCPQRTLGMAINADSYLFHYFTIHTGIIPQAEMSKWMINEKQGQARGYGHITRNECCPKWANTSNLNNSKMAEYFYELFQDMKIWDICDHLQLIACIFIKSSLNESILKTSFQKEDFSPG